MRSTPFLVLSVAAAVLLAGCSTAESPPASESTPSSTAPSAATPAAPSETTNGPTPAAPAPSAPDASDGQCRTENLTVSITEQGSSAGHLHYAVTFTNTGSECMIVGFPSVQVTAGGTPLGVAATEDSRTAAISMSLTRGGTTSADLAVVNIASGGGPLGDACTVAQGDAFAVTPPHSTSAISVPMPNVPACSNGTPWMTVGPVVNYGTT